MFTIAKDFAFSASHQLGGLPPEHQCARLHGHNYTVTVELSGRALDPTGFVLDYGKLAHFKKWIDTHLDHRHLNDRLDFNPTAEQLAQHLAVVVAELLGIPLGEPTGIGELYVDEQPWVSGVCVSETPKTTAWFRP